MCTAAGVQGELFVDEIFGSCGGEIVREKIDERL
jgi:hypothetical protein